MTSVGPKGSAPTQPEGGTVTQELPKLQGSAKQVEWADRQRAQKLDPSAYHASIRHVAEAMVPVIGSAASEYTEAGDWLPGGKATFPDMFRRRFGLPTGESAGWAYRTVEDHLHYLRQMRDLGQAGPSDLDAGEFANMVTKLGREKASEIVSAFGITPQSGGAK